MWRIKKGRVALYECNELKKGQDRILIIGSVLSAARLYMKRKLLNRHREKQIELQDEEEKSIDSFTASESWCRKFAKDQDWKLTTLHGEAGSVDDNVIQKKLKNLCSLIDKYKPKNVFNMDETGYFFQLMPNQSYVQRIDTKRA